MRMHLHRGLRLTGNGRSHEPVRRSNGWRPSSAEAQRLEPAPAPPAETMADIIARAAADESARITSVFKSEACEGKERAAARLLTSTDLTAGEILEILADMNPDSAASGRFFGGH